MKRARVIKRTLLTLLLIGLGAGAYYCWYAFPIISGYSAKNACSCAFIQGRTAQSIAGEELGSFPLSLGSFSIDYKDSSVTAKVAGLASRKAIYRSGFGCTLVNEVDEATLRNTRAPLRAEAVAEDTAMVLYAVDSGTVLVNGDAVKKAMEIAFQKEFRGKASHSRALLIVHRGRVIGERYGEGYNHHSQFLGWSMAKSITSTLIGVLVQRGSINVATPAPVPEWKGLSDGRQNITTAHLLQQMSGLDFVEDYGSYSHVTNMLFNKGDMGAYVADRPLKHRPGTEFYYSSGNSNLLSRIIRHTVGEKAYADFPGEALFRPLGMQHTLLEPDASGTFVGSSYVYASARDYARFGQLYLNDGVWNGRRILPQGWVAQTVTAPATNKLAHYGYQFWLNGRDDKDPSKKAYPEAPDDLFYADGFGGQRIFVIPSKQLVIVRMGLNAFDEHAFLKTLLAAF